RFDRGVSRHQGDAARVAAEIDGRQIGIAGNDANIKRIDAQNFGDDVGENRIRTLANFRRSAKDAHAAAAIQLQLDAGVRQLVVVDWSLRARHVSAARDSNPFSVRQLSEFIFPAGTRNHFVDALAQGERADSNTVRRYRVGSNRVLLAYLRRIEFQLIGDLVHLDFLDPTRLRSAVASLLTSGVRFG